MKLSYILLAAGLAQSVLTAPLLRRDGSSIATANGHDAPTQSTGTSITRRGREYSLMDDLDELEEEAEEATQAQLDASVNYLVDLFQSNNIDYALMGGIALQKYGMPRTTHDSDIVVSVNAKGLLSAVAGDESILQPSVLTAASGTARLFIKIGDQQVQSDVFVQGGDLTPSLTTATTQDGYRVVSIREIINYKLKRLEDKDYTDIMWLITHKATAVRDGASSIDANLRYSFAQEVGMKDNSELDHVVEVLQLDKDEVYDR